MKHQVVFDEKELQREIIAKWGVYGAHNEVFMMIMDDLAKAKLRIKDLEEQLRLKKGTKV